jgi:hypothetical protein
MIALEFIKSVIPANWRKTPSGWISGNCPMCNKRGHNPDKRRRGGIILSDDKFSYNCFNCGFKTGWTQGHSRRISGRLQELLETFGVDPAQIQRVNFELLKEQEEANIAQQFIQTDKPREVSINWKPMALPPDAKVFYEVDTNELNKKEMDQFVAAVEYVHKRGVDFYSNWMWSKYKHFANRVILPFYYQGQTVGYTARWIGETPNKETPKYYLKSPNHFVYNLDAQKNHKYTIVTEGQFDALLVGGVAMQGNTPSMTQCDIIDKLGTEIIVVPDADRAGMELVKTAIKRGWNVSFPPWEDCKDAADAVQKYGRLFTVRSIIESTESNSTKIQLLAKSYCR